MYLLGICITNLFLSISTTDLFVSNNYASLNHCLKDLFILVPLNKLNAY